MAISHAVCTQKTINVSASSSNAGLNTEFDLGDQGSSNQIIELERPVVWGALANARFKELSREEALRDLSAAETLELDELTRLRRMAKYPRSAEEILWQRRQQKVTDALVNALKVYVDFHHGTNHP